MMATKQALSSFNLQFRRGDRFIKMTTKQKNTIRISCSSFDTHVTDPYKVLRIRPGASKPQVKKAFRELAKQYHPDVCKGKDCGVQFEEINAAYEEVMSYLRGGSRAYGRYDCYEDNNEGMNQNHPFRGYHEAYNNNKSNEHVKGRSDQHWDYGDEWIGWEVGNWMFYQHQQETDEATSSEETKELNTNSCYSQIMDTSSYNTPENISG